MKGILKKGYSSEWGRCLIAAGMTAVFFLVINWKSHVVFFINDDENILYSLAGYYTNGIPGDHSFVNYLLAAFIGGLYSLIPAVPWYGVFHVVVLFLSVMAISMALLRIAEKSHVPLFAALCLISSMVLLCYLYPVTLMQFTTTSAMAGTAAVALLVSADMDEENNRIVDHVLSGVFMVVCYCHRKNTGNVILCFYTLVMVYQLAKRFCALGEAKNKVKKTLINKGPGCFFATLLCIIFAVLISQNVVRTNEEWNNFYKFDEARFKVTDYDHDSYWENPELYEEMGWSASLYRLCATGYLFFMDERVNAESFEAISETGYQNTDSSLSQCFGNFSELINNERLARICFGLLIVLFATSVGLALRCWKKNICEVVLVCCAVGGAALMSFYLCWKGRFILRAFQTILYPAIVIAVATLFRVMGNLPRVKRSCGRIVSCFVAILLMGGLVLSLGYQMLTETRLLAHSRIEKSARTHMVEEYAIENPDNMYIYDTSLTFRYSPFVTYTDGYPSNLSYWGGMGWNSPTFWEQVRQNGLEDLNSDVFFEENVYYVSYSEFTAGGELIKDIFMEYMTETYGNVTIEQVDEITPEILVYKLSKGD